MTDLTFLLLMIVPGLVLADEIPREGPARLAAIRKQLSGTVSKFEFTQGYDFRKQPDRLRPLMKAIKARGFDTWDQTSGSGMWREKELADLERSLQVASEEGLRVWATLSPPSESDELARTPVSKRRDYYYTAVEQFARLAAKYPQFVAFTCDDFSYNDRFFTPEVMAEMARRWRAICPRLAFLPLLYYPGVRAEFFKERGAYIDGIVFHFRAESYPPAIIPAYDPKNFEMYGDVMRYELKKVRQIAGNHTVICGIYVWYYEDGWGVLTPDGKRPSIEHVVRDAVQKFTIAHEYADGVRVYGLGIDHDAYAAMGRLAGDWHAAGGSWGSSLDDTERHLKRWQTQPTSERVLGTLLESGRGLGHDLPQATPWSRWEVLVDLERKAFVPDDAVHRHPLLLVSKSCMMTGWPKLLEEYARAGGVLALESMPGWSLDPRATEPTRKEQRAGNRGVLTLEFARLAGIVFRHEPRGYATRWRVLKDHPLTKGLGEPGVWQPTTPGRGETAYPYLVYPVTGTLGEVLVEVEHEQCPYDGITYVRKGKISGTHPLLTINQLGRGLVIRHYAAVSPQAVFGKSYQRLLANLIQLAADRHPSR